MIRFISITQDDIDRAVNNSTSKCAVALALTRAIGNLCFVNGQTFSVYGDWGVYTPLPQEVINWGLNASLNKEVKPITFKIYYERKNI